MFKYAVNLVFRRKLRTFLASLGVTISVILLSFIIFGMQDLKGLFVNEFSSRFSPNQLVVSKASFSFILPENTEEEPEEPVVINQAIVDKIKSKPQVQNISSAVIISGMRVKVKSEDKYLNQAFVVGWDVKGDSNFFVDFVGDKNKPEKGEAFIAQTLLDLYDLQPSEVIGKKVVVESSPTSFLSSKTKGLLDLKREYRIVGVVDTGQDRSDVVLPLDEGIDLLSEIGGFDDGQEFIEQIGYDQLMIDLYSQDDVEEFKKYLEEELSLSVFSADDILSFLDVIIQGLTIFLVVFGLISGVVASIGIINTMVMTIYEQTREIGINKAIGASNIQVLIIFLIQSGLIGFIGGIMGLAVVFVGMKFGDPQIVKILQDAGFGLEQFFHFNLQTAGLITLGSILVGILAGIYPAFKAARLDPVKALRYE